MFLKYVLDGHVANSMLITAFDAKIRIHVFGWGIMN